MEERQLEITIDNVPFRVDSKRGRLIEISNPQNQIKRQDLKDEGSWYRTIYDRNTKNIHKGWLTSRANNDNVLHLNIPKLLFYPTLALDESLIAKFRMECKKLSRGFEVIGSKPAMAFKKLETRVKKKSSGRAAQ